LEEKHYQFFAEGTMVMLVLHCPYCDGIDIVRHGKSPEGKQRYRCREKPCNGRTFLRDYSPVGQSPHVKDQTIEMTLNGSRATARVLHVSMRTVLNELNSYTLGDGGVRCMN
jgi:transposase-like protein